MKKTAILIFLVFVLWIVFVAGRISGSQEAIEIDDLKSKSIAALNAMGAYTVKVEIAGDISAGNSGKALCLVQVSASADIMKVKECLGNLRCKAAIQTEVQRVAPELLGDGVPKIKFFNFGEKCVPN
jgi:hypothetical protein